MTIVELFCKAIQKSYIQFVKEGLIKIDVKHENEINGWYDEMLNTRKCTSIFLILMKIHSEKVKGTRVGNIIMAELDK